MVFQVAIQSADALDLDDETRTVKLNADGEAVTLTLAQTAQGKRLFNQTCGSCHAGGVTKTDPNVGLEPETLAGATPPRDNIEALVDYMKNPTTYDGFREILDLHPNTQRSDLFPKMRNLSDEDLFAIAGYIMVQPKVVGIKWGGGKIYF
jgi:photosystem II cytochrome c550